MSILYYYIDEQTRELRPEAARKVVAQKDHNADVIRIGVPEALDSVDLETSAVRCMYQRPKETEVRSKTATYYDTSGGYLWYDWTLQEGDTAKVGKINFSVCLQHVESGLLSVDWNTTIGEIHVKTSCHSDDGDSSDETITPTAIERIAVLEATVDRLKNISSGVPQAVGEISDMTDTTKIYVFSTDGKWYWYDGSDWVAGGVYGAATTDTTLSIAGAPADAKKVGDILEAVKFALLDCFMNVAWINDDGQSYYDALEAAFNNESRTLLSITAIFTQGSNVIYDTDTLDSLKEYLVVTANYDDESSKVITGYTLSGTLTIGTSTITVSYGGKTTTFNVIVSGRSVVYKLSDGTLSTLVKGTMTTVDNRPCILQSGAGQVINVLTGDVPFLIKATVSSAATESVYYPIPIPSSATRVTVSVLPNTFQINANIRKYENGAFTIITTGDKLASVQYDFTASEDLYVVGRVQSSDGTDVDASNVTDVIIECE